MSANTERFRPHIGDHLPEREIVYAIPPVALGPLRERPLRRALPPEGILPEEVLNRLHAADQPNGVNPDEDVEVIGAIPKRKSRSFWKRMARAIHTPDKARKAIGTALISSAEEFFPEFPERDKTTRTKVREKGKKAISFPFRTGYHLVKEGARKLTTGETKFGRFVSKTAEIIARPKPIHYFVEHGQEIIAEIKEIRDNIHDILKGDKIRRQSFLYVASLAIGTPGPLLALTKINLPNVKQALHEKKYGIASIEAALTIADITPLAIAIKAGVGILLAGGISALAPAILTLIGISSVSILFQWATNTFLFEAYLNRKTPSNKDYVLAARDVLSHGEVGKRQQVLQLVDERLTKEASHYAAFRNPDGSVRTSDYVEALATNLTSRIAELDRLIHAPQSEGEKTDVSELERVENEALLGKKPSFPHIFKRLGRGMFVSTSVKYHRALLEGHKRELVWARNLRDVLIIYKKERYGDVETASTAGPHASLADIVE